MTRFHADALMLGWRLGHVRRRARQITAARALQLIERSALLHRLPRGMVARIEAALLSAEGSAAFKPEGYLAANPDVRAEGRDALGHYLHDGWREGRSGGAPDGLMARAVRPGAPVSPLAAALAARVGRRQADEPRLSAPDLPTLEPLLERLAALRPTGCAEQGAIDVIVPVYRGRIETLNAIVRVLEASNRTPFRLVVVDDCGPDPELRRDLARLAARGLCDLVRQPRNLGFVAAINAGMRRHPGRDAIWLNADTEVYGDWIDRLVRVAGTDTRIATVTPLTNNGTIASYPRFDRDNPAPLEVPWTVVDRLAAEANGDRSVDVPTCVGFCVFVRRAAWDDSGPLDESAFGRGYGEENDFSCRAAARGWRNVIAGGVYVRHLGGCSFGPEKGDRIAAAMRAMARRHPGYAEAVRTFVTTDPVASLRRNLDLARLRRSMPARPAMIVTHMRGGGTARHVDEMVTLLRRSGRAAVMMTGGVRPGTVALRAPGLAPLPSLEAIERKVESVAPILDALRICEIAVHHTIELGAGGPDLLLNLARRAEVPLDVTLHDYFSICPRINLVDSTGRYCGEPDEAGCRRCLARRGSEVGQPNIAGWRQAHERLLRGAETVRVPDLDVAERMRRYFPGLNVKIVPHESVVSPSPALPRPPLRHGVRIAVIGAIGPIKGFDVLLRLAWQSRSEGPKAEFVVIGHTRNDAAARSAGIQVTGRYREADISSCIKDADPDLIFIPSTWPETFCYTLSHAMRSGRLVAAFDLGAQGRRLAAHDPRGVLPLALAAEPGELLRRLVALAQGGEAPCARRALSETSTRF